MFAAHSREIVLGKTKKIIFPDGCFTEFRQQSLSVSATVLQISDGLHQLPRRQFLVIGPGSYLAFIQSAAGGFSAAVRFQLTVDRDFRLDVHALCRCLSSCSHQFSAAVAPGISFVLLWHPGGMHV